ncbi:DNA-protecting protein DprA [Herbaspirillum sp. AP02]|uniref:DNA-processing protein DprA n=1 Tax=unclassified Herbaspirillum TaxID=2624150 RepID=UPI0015D9F6B4|nr:MULTISPECIES: DNA-processing protein DprA [unclassified Herbaspirillum]MBG7621763.1 DNA-protecting protein DprA [Herbaspirillum sp. AP02]NZD67143.1 DNA-protecting protein DprA [Herbaspirillum sp. AP21]
MQNNFPFDATPADPGRLDAWLRLAFADGIGPVAARRLLAAFGLPGQIWQAQFSALCAVVSPRQAATLLAPPSGRQRERMEATLDWLQTPGRAVVTLADAAYPAALLNIPDPPLLLYVRGDAALLSAPALAVVGSRHATVQGRAHAMRFSEELSHAGLSIVSGLAMGIDAAAHEGGLRGAGSTVAVIGTGCDIDYPSRNRELAERIAQGGCIVSEYALGTPPLSANFPRRNRVISGLAQAVLVVEAAARSGSLITARMAAEQGRDVFAIPGSIHAPLSKGCHQLIRQGAKLVETTQDILEELPLRQAVAGIAQAQAAAGQLPDDDDPASLLVMRAMGHDPVDVDTLVQRCGLDAAALAAILLGLELQGRVEVLPGAHYRYVA